MTNNTIEPGDELWDEAMEYADEVSETHKETMEKLAKGPPIDEENLLVCAIMERMAARGLEPLVEFRNTTGEWRVLVWDGDEQGDRSLVQTDDKELIRALLDAWNEVS